MGNMYVFLILSIGLVCTVKAKNCLTPETVRHFDNEKFEGEWYHMAVAVPNATMSFVYEGHSCVKGNFKRDSNHYNVKGGYKMNNKHEKFEAQYIRDDASKPVFTMNSASHPEYSGYKHTVVCTDYRFYALVYFHTQFESNKCGDVIVIYGRDPTKYDEIMDNSSLKRCLEVRLHASVQDFQSINPNDCEQ